MTSQNEITCWLVINKLSWWFYTSLQMTVISDYPGDFIMTLLGDSSQCSGDGDFTEKSSNEGHRRVTRWRANEDIYLPINTQQSPWIHIKVIKWRLFERNRWIKVITFWFTVVCDTRAVYDITVMIQRLAMLNPQSRWFIYATPAVYIIKFRPINFGVQRLAFCFYHLIYRHQSNIIDFNNMERKRTFVWYELRCSL